MTTPTAPSKPTAPAAPAAPAAPKPPTAVKPPAAPETGSKPGRKPGQKAREYDFTGITLDSIAAPRAVTPEMKSRTAPSRSRDERQIKMDEIVRKTHAAWVSAGKPTKWAQMPAVQYNVAPAAEEAFSYLVRRAAEFLGLAIKWGNPSGTKINDEDGNVVLVFAVRDRRTRDEVESEDDEDDEDDSDN